LLHLLATKKEKLRAENKLLASLREVSRALTSDGSHASGNLPLIQFTQSLTDSKLKAEISSHLLLLKRVNVIRADKATINIAQLILIGGTSVNHHLRRV
jgi:hypothetical protein